MSVCRKRGSALVEMALLVPYFFLLVLAVVLMGLLAVRQYRLEQCGIQTLRKLALSKVSNQDELIQLARRFIAEKYGDGIEVELDVRPLLKNPRDTGAAAIHVLGLNLIEPVVFQERFGWTSRWRLKAAAKDVQVIK